MRDALRRIFTWRNAVAGGFLMAVLLMAGTAGYSGLRSAGIGPLGSLLAKGVFESNESLILADFDDRTSDETLGETVTALFRIDLNQSTSLHLLERRELSPGLVRMQVDPTDPLTHEVAMELAQREGMKAVVSGEVLPLGPGAVVSTRLVAAGSGEILVALRETARTVDAVPDAVDRLSAQLRERIGESLRSIRGDPPLGEVTTGFPGGPPEVRTGGVGHGYGGYSYGRGTVEGGSCPGLHLFHGPPEAGCHPFQRGSG